MTFKPCSVGKTAIAVSMIGIFGACAPMATSLQNPTGVRNKILENPVVVEKGDVLSCLSTVVDYELTTSITSFEMVNKGGFSFGFNQQIGVLPPIEADVQYSSGTLTTAMQLWDPLKSSIPLSNAEGSHKLKTVSFGLGFLASIFKFGFKFYHQTPIYTLTENAIAKNLQNLVKAMNASEQKWDTNIVKVVDTKSFIVPVGYLSGLAVGDPFDVYVTQYDWTGAPCQSDLMMPRLSKNVIGKAVVAQVDADYAYLELKSEAFAKLDLHMKVVPALPPPDAKGVVGAAKAYKKSLRIRSVDQVQKIKMTDSTGVTGYFDLSQFAAVQLQSQVGLPENGGFWYRQ